MVAHVSVEDENGRGFALCQTASEVQAAQDNERARAVALCERLSDELAISNPTRSAELAAAAADPSKTACELFGLAKLDGRVCSNTPIAVYVLLGQSNAEGRGTAPYYGCVEDETRMWSAVGWVDLVDPIGGVGGSTAPRLADYLRANGEASVGFIECARGGTNSNAWVPNPSNPYDGSTLFGEELARIAAAMNAAPSGSTIKGVILYHGENNAKIGNAEEWQPDWSDALDTLATELAVWLAPEYQEVIVCLPEADVTGYPYWQPVRAVQTATATARGALLVQAPVAALDSGLHLDTGADDTEGHRKLAVDIGAALLAV